MKPIIKMECITKSYKGVPAIKEIDFDLRKGEIHALLGENGAGKSTLTKVMAGAVEANAGKMIFNGRKVSFTSPHEALNGVSGNQPCPVHDSCTKSLSWVRKFSEPTARNLHLSATVFAIPGFSS